MKFVELKTVRVFSEVFCYDILAIHNNFDMPYDQEVPGNETE